jgi:beta-lactamase class D
MVTSELLLSRPGGKHMLRNFAVSLIMALATVTPAFAAISSQLTDAQMSDEFKGYSGSFEIKDLSDGTTFRYNDEILKKRDNPNSTFKIVNSLIALDSGVLKVKDSTMKWDGKKREIETHNKDQDMQSAMTNSCVWYFQRVAEKIGKERMQKYLHTLKYGNEDSSSGLTTFWLGNDGSLRVSPDEQVDFLARLFEDKLPVSKQSMSDVRQLIKLKTEGDNTLFGKTGTGPKAQFGWFVGAVKHADKTYVFATNVRANENAYGKQARKITESILSKMGLL